MTYLLGLLPTPKTKICELCYVVLLIFLGLGTERAVVSRIIGRPQPWAPLATHQCIPSCLGYWWWRMCVRWRIGCIHAARCRSVDGCIVVAGCIVGSIHAAWCRSAVGVGCVAGCTLVALHAHRGTHRTHIKTCPRRF